MINHGSCRGGELNYYFKFIRTPNTRDGIIRESPATCQPYLHILPSSSSRAEKEKAKFQAELYELLAQVEGLNKDKFIQVKTIEKLEVSITDLSVRIEELNRTIIDITSHKTRIQAENIELIKEVQDLKINIENVTYSRSQVVMQLDDTTRKLEDENRRRSTLESQLHQVGLDLDSVRSQLDEESEIRLDLERQLVKANGDVQIWRNKYETEAAARVEEIEEIRRKYSARIQEQEEHIESLLVKLNNLEKVKMRLQSEVEVLIIDLEKSNGTCRELSKRVEQFERTTVELKTRLDEVTLAYDQAQRDLRNRVAEIQRLNHDLEKAADQNAVLGRENKKLGDENREFRNTLSEMTRRLHESDLEIRRLETERDELNAAYKEAEAVSCLLGALERSLANDCLEHCFRPAVLRRSAPRPWPLSLVSTATTPSAVFLRRMRRSKSSGKCVSAFRINSCRHIL